MSGTRKHLPAPHVYWRGDVAQRLRLFSGLVLLAFASSHFLNHAVGLIGLEEMHRAQAWRMAVTRSWPGTVLLLGSLFIHLALGMWKLAQRRNLRMPLWETLQIAIALVIPFSLLPHIVDTRVAAQFFGAKVLYIQELAHLWPAKAIGSIGLMLLVWVHSCVGMHYWLRLSPAYWRVAPLLLVIAIAVPLLGSAGFVSAGRATVEIMAEPGAVEEHVARSNRPDPAGEAQLAVLNKIARYIFLLPMLLVAGSLGWRWVISSKEAVRAVSLNGQFRTRKFRASEPVAGFLDGPSVRAVAGATLLETSRAAGVTQASLCGGRARCGTCRVRVISGLSSLPAPSSAELQALAAIEAPPDVRLACQIRPTADLTVEVLVKPEHLVGEPVEFIELKQIAAAHRLAGIISEGDKEALGLVCTSESVDAPINNVLRRLTRADLTLVGERTAYLYDHPIRAFTGSLKSYRTTLFALPLSTARAAFAVGGSAGGINVVGWSDASYAWYLASDAPFSALEALIERAGVTEELEIMAMGGIR